MKIGTGIVFLLSMLIAGCSNMVNYYAGYQTHSKVEVKKDTFNGNYIISSTQVGLRANLIDDNPSFLSIIKSPDSDDLSVVAMTYLTLNTSFYPSYAEDKQQNKLIARQAWTDVSCDKSSGVYACRWITQVATVLDWEDAKAKLVEPMQLYMFRIHGNGMADTAIHSCQMWEVMTELNRLRGDFSPVTQFGGKPCYS
ncbi:hypothetical protein L1D40_07245 [Shewanella insulae]|uniref:hypothetical protein n=1 Tax=Shewanella insulae TaxID=2681496 RepID=UPI001EFE7831|nr:hypothetical protein [Shewanella insulae]MCG9755015.1 hypothetical protein [Shewanella insulae]